MNEARHRLLGLCLPALLLCALDGGLTLLGQPPEYWAGNYERANEMSPTFNHLLRAHPLAFAAGLALWGAVFCAIVLLLNDTLALAMGIAVTFGHLAGATTWLLWRFQYSYQACNALFLATALMLAVGIRWGWRARPPHTDRPLGWPPVVRWLAVALLIGVAIYLFLWPRTT